MATRSSTGSVLAAMAILAIFAGSAMGQGDASFNIVNDGQPGSILANGVQVHCFDNDGHDLPATTLLPGQSLFQAFPLISFLELIFTCEVHLDTPSGALQQKFDVWKQDQGDFQNFLNECNDCKWSIVPDGFYWHSDRQNSWIREYVWSS
ncbi:unnamed protein product [Calypogeia fissa]